MGSQPTPAESPGSVQACVSLCYDGFELSHLETVVPCLNEFELSGTFFGDSSGVLQHVEGWRKAVETGHEMGCHSLLHAADERGNLDLWTLEMVQNDLRMSRNLLEELFPTQSDFSFAYPGPEARCVSVPYDPKPVDYRAAVRSVFAIARSAQPGFNDPNSLDFAYLHSLDMAGASAEEMIDLAARAQASGSWALFAFKGVGTGERAVDAYAHRAFCGWLSERASKLGSKTVCAHARGMKVSQHQTPGEAVAHPKRER